MTPTDTNNVRLVELGDAPYHDYSKALVRDYAADKVRAGTWSQAEAEGRSARDDSTDADVGIVWFALRNPGVGRSVWIYDIIIKENFRRKGYASRTLELVEDRARE